MAETVGIAAAPAARLGTRRRQRLASRIAAVAPLGPLAGSARPAAPRRPADSAGWRRWPRQLLDPLLGIDRSLASDEPMPLAPSLIAAAAAAALAWGVGHLLLGISGVLPVVAGAGAALMAARAMVSGKRDAVRAQMEEQFELALGVIIRCVRAGLPVNEGMRAVALEIPTPTGPEFRQAVDQMQLGTSFDAALQALADRCAIADYRFFATAVALQRQTGGNLAETLENLADTMRKRRAVRMKAKALTSETRATVVVLALLPAVVAGVMLLINPDYIMQLIDNPSGRRMLGAAIVIQAIGLAVIRAISRKTVG